MNLRSVAFLGGLAAAGLMGQIGSNTVTVNVSRNAAPQMDVAVFGVTVTGGVDQTLDDVVRALAGLGITAGNLTGVSSSSYSRTPPYEATGISWGFQWTAPLAKVKDATAGLMALQKTVQQRNPKLSLFFSLAGTQPSPQQSPNCDIAGLVADARGQAQKLAGAAGLVAAGVVGIEGSVNQGLPGCALNVTFALGYSGQPGPHTISITASRTVALPKDRVGISLTVDSRVGAGLEDVVGVLASAGVSGAVFTGVYSGYYFDLSSNPSPTPSWLFSLTAPLARVNEVLGQLSAAQVAIARQNPSFGLTFGVQGLESAAQAEASCSDADLVGDAKAMAQKVAGAAGVSVGAVVGLGKGSAVGGGYSAQFLLGAISETTVGVVWPSYAGFVVPSYSSEAGCGVTVQFGLY